MNKMTKKELIDAAAGRVQCTLVIKNAFIADVFNGKFIIGNVGVLGDKIVGIGDYRGETEIDGTGKYVMPSFYDTHLHFESVMIRPSEYLKHAIPKGVTSFNADPHEIANVCGESGVKFMMDDVKNIPADVHFMLPSCVPATAEDHSACVLNAEKTKNISKRLNFFGLGEMMNYPGVIGGDADTIEKLEVKEIIDGHAPSVCGNALNAYLCGGILTDHECATVEEALTKTSSGMYVMVREGSQTKNLKTIIKAVNTRNLRRFLFCTDDRNVEDLLELGTVSNAVKMAIDCGLSPVDAVTIASLNAYEAYGIKNHGAIAPGYSADFLICGDDKAVNIEKVFYHGKMVAKDGRALFDTQPANAKPFYKSMHIKPLKEGDFEFEFKQGMPVMKVFPNTVVTECVTAKSKDKLNLMCSIERHDATGNMGKCFVEGFDLKGGAIAQTIGHDAHNITVLGDNSRDMLMAVAEIGVDGGLVVVKGGKVIGRLPLEIGGIMSDMPAEYVLETRKKLFAALAEMDYNKEIEPFMLLSFMTLIVIPDVKLNHKGLFSVNEWKYLYKNDNSSESN